MKLTIVTATTPDRVHWVTNMMELVHDQLRPNTEHLVVCDGESSIIEQRAKNYGSRFLSLINGPHNDFGANAHQHGLENASGQYVCFWDDDNAYRALAVQTVLNATSLNCDIVVVQVRHYATDHTAKVRLIPPTDWQPPKFTCGKIDTSCVVVRREFGLKTSWIDAKPDRMDSDYQWLNRLSAFSPDVAFLPVVIGVHS